MITLSQRKTMKPQPMPTPMTSPTSSTCCAVLQQSARQQSAHQRCTLPRGRLGWCGIALWCLGFWVVLSPSHVFGQPPQCDPTKILTADSCAKCHLGEVETWKQTPHFQTFEELHRDPRAKEIAQKMGQRSIKRGNLCINCHYTLREEDGRLKAVSGVSCESCHGAAQDWLALHNDYGGPTATKESETPEHAEQRVAESIAAGMRNPRNLYLVAQSCLQCHTVPNELLVNQGGHLAGSDQFELVAWSQGRVRHNFLRTDGKSNGTNPVEKLRVMYVIGQIADLEYSTRATALATERGKYGLTVANRAATVATRLFEIQQQINHPTLQEILLAFADAELRVNNTSQLNQIADQIKQLGIQFADEVNGTELAAVDVWLPDPRDYR